MDKKDWFDCGARIGDLVQSAIDSDNYQHLNESITDAINDTVEALSKSFFGGAGEKHGEYRAKKTAYESAKERANTGDLMDAFLREGNQTRGMSGRAKKKQSFRGIASMITGFSLAAGFGIAALVFGLLSAFVSGGFLFFTILFTILAAASGILGWKGLRTRKANRRMQQYMNIVGEREYCTIEELAAGSGRSAADVRKDLRSMIADGIFPGAAYLDEGETTLMVSQNAYRQYQDAKKASRAREAELAKQAELRRDAEKNMASMSEETRKILEEGREFIRHIHECNEKIPGDEMTEKLTKLEQVVTRIFAQVEQHPENAPDLHRMMSYYLPITRKLIDAYVDLEGKELQGKNVQKTRREIELSLDTINGAFETFLDSFFEDTAWDISSDISTLKTMMARDGLTGGSDFSSVKTVADDLKAKPASAAGGAAAASGALGKE